MKTLVNFISKDKALMVDIKMVVDSAIKHLQESEVTSFVLVYRAGGQMYTKGHSGKSICEAVGMLEAAKMDLLFTLEEQ